jgi:aryl-alcohol dehydrogenase-like predicted oxidoreductase
MKLKRREFLAKSLTGVGSILLGSKFATAQQQKKIDTFDPYELVPLGKTKLMVSRVGFGTGTFGWQRQSNQTKLGKEKFETLIKAAYDRGIRLFDAADLYGTHPYIGQALSKVPRENYVIISKIWWRAEGLPEKERPDADVIVKRFLKELNTDYIDAVLLHCLTSANWPKELRKQMDILDMLKQKGIIRAHGISCHSIQALEAAIDQPWVESVHTRINPYGTKMDGPPEKVAPVLKRLHQAGKAIVGMKIIGEGQFRDSDEKRNHSISSVLGLSCVDTMIVGFEKPEEIDDFAARVRKVPIVSKIGQPC